MSTFQKCDSSVTDLAQGVMKRYECFAPLIDRKVRIDFMFAFGQRDETTGDLVSDALKKNGVKALGITRKIPLKDRAKGLGDAEVCLDGDWWPEHDTEEQQALIDHELYHIAVTPKNDDLGRPILKLRKHDFEMGWFAAVAERHGAFSQERQQAGIIMQTVGQLFWPEIMNQNKGRFAQMETKVETK